MKSLLLLNPTHIRLEAGFADWLELMGYAGSSVYGMPLHLREFLHWLEQENKPLETVSSQEIEAYFFHLGKRKNQRRTGTLSASHLKKHLQAIKRFSHYLRETHQGELQIDGATGAQIRQPNSRTQKRAVLTPEEITRLYEACTDTALGLRDRAMLGVFYGCGLRRTEGVMLDAEDFLPTRNLLYVRSGKGYKERYVPVSGSVRGDLSEYLTYGRPDLLRNRTETAFFISERGTRPQGQSLYLRLKLLVEKAEIDKSTCTEHSRGIGLHALRHSIATHLLKSGMELTEIAAFLGHSSLESTQIYTQLT